MADNVAITAGTGTPIATDEVAVNGGTTAHVQYVKLVDGTGNGTTGIAGDSNGLYVVQRRDIVESSVTSSGLTIVTTSYATADQMGSMFTVPNAGRVNGGYGYITGVTLISAADNINAVDVVFFTNDGGTGNTNNVTLAADNAAFSISDADALKIIGLVQLSGAYDIGGNRVAQAYNLATPYKCASQATSIFAALITRSSHTFFAAATDLQLNVYMERA